jgi:hypothetical protein
MIASEDSRLVQCDADTARQLRNLQVCCAPEPHAHMNFPGDESNGQKNRRMVAPRGEAISPGNELYESA